MTRVISGAVLIALTVALVWFASPLAFESFAILVGLLAVSELVRLVRVAPAILIALVYIALPLAALVQIRAQFYTGRAFGRRPLAPAISPKKTIEGAIGGFVFGTVALVVIGAWWAPQLRIATRVVLGFAIVALGIGGDLFESFLKRRAGVKDSSALIPGHGGVLDRIDALLFAAPLYYLVLKYAE
ncbi:MAG: hypothetical protein DMG01_11405 [Acidobacteria bacterium]|nr:MAG: hypothetical protein DMG01_11405 [Acidobacteriota bacterium]